MTDTEWEEYSIIDKTEYEKLSKEWSQYFESFDSDQWNALEKSLKEAESEDK